MTGLISLRVHLGYDMLVSEFTSCLRLNDTQLCEHATFCLSVVCSSSNGHVGCRHLWAIVFCVAMTVFVSSVYIHRSGATGSYGNSICKVSGDLFILLSIETISFYVYTNSTQVLFLPSSPTLSFPCAYCWISLRHFSYVDNNVFDHIHSPLALMSSCVPTESLLLN